MIIKALCSQRSLHKIHYMTAWRMVCLLTWAPGVKEQDKLNPSWLAEGQGVATYRCVRGRADGQGHHVPGGADDSGAPAGGVNVGRQTKGGPGAILLRGLRTCMKQWIRSEPWDHSGKRLRNLGKTFVPGEWKLTGYIFTVFPTMPKFSSNISGISFHARTA